MIEYVLGTPEQKELATLAREILEKELTPRLEELEKANGGKGEYPMDIHKKMAEAGYCGMCIPEEWGGLGLDHVTRCMILEEMARVDVGFAFTLYGGTVYFDLIAQTAMSHAAKQEWADKILNGDSLIAFCLTEPQAGSDASAIRTTAVKDGNEWVLNGTKCFISHAPVADGFLVFAWTDQSVSSGKGISAFFVEKERGIQIGTIENKMGLKLSCTAEVILEDVRVPEDHIVGSLGSGLKYALGGINDARVVSMAQALGISQAAVDFATTYAQTRVTFGKRIIDHPSVADLLARMQTRTSAARALIYYAATCLDQGINDSMLCSATKNFVAESTMQNTIDAVQVYGGYGYMKDYPVEKLMRDAKIYEIFEGTTQINNIVIARGMDKKYK